MQIVSRRFTETQSMFQNPFDALLTNNGVNVMPATDTVPLACLELYCIAEWSSPKQRLGYGNMSHINASLSQFYHPKWITNVGTISIAMMQKKTQDQGGGSKEENILDSFLKRNGIQSE